MVVVLTGIDHHNLASCRLLLHTCMLATTLTSPDRTVRPPTLPTHPSHATFHWHMHTAASSIHHYHAIKPANTATPLHLPCAHPNLTPISCPHPLRVMMQPGMARAPRCCCCT